MNSFLFHKSPGVHSSAKKIPSKYFPQIDTDHSTIFDRNCGKWIFFEIVDEFTLGLLWSKNSSTYVK